MVFIDGVEGEREIHHLSNTLPEMRIAAEQNLLETSLLYVGRVATLNMVQTNMVYVRFPEERRAKLAGQLKERGILVYPGNPMRLVTHLDVSAEDIDRVLEAFGEIL